MTHVEKRSCLLITILAGYKVTRLEGVESQKWNYDYPDYGSIQVGGNTEQGAGDLRSGWFQHVST